MDKIFLSERFLANQFVFWQKHPPMDSFQEEVTSEIQARSTLNQAVHERIQESIVIILLLWLKAK